MAARKTGLGRGLDALIPVEHPTHGFAEVPIDAIHPNPQQPRESFDEEALESLAASIREVGLLQPIVVRPGEEEGRYALVAGERRWRAASMAGLHLVPAVIRDEATDETNLTEALIENLQREDLSPLEEAAAYRHLMEDFSMTHDQIAERVGKSRSAVTNTLRLLQLPAAIQGMLERGSLSAGHARALVGMEDEVYAIHIAEQAAREGWSVRGVEEAVRVHSQSRRRPPAATRPRPPAIIELEERLTEHLGTGVRIQYSGRGGRMVVRFSSLDDLERIYRQLFGS